MSFPKTDSEKYFYAYECPSCKKQIVRAFWFFPDLLDEGTITTQFTCSYQFCDVKQIITYRLSKKKSKEPKLKIISFSSEGKEYKKKFSLWEEQT